MEKFQYGHACHDKWQIAVNDCLLQVNPIPPAANFGFIYVTDFFVEELTSIVAYLKQHTAIDHWVGTVGISICVTGHEYHDEPAITIMLCDFPEDSFRIFSTGPTDFESTIDQYRSWFNENTIPFGIVHCSPTEGQSTTMLASLSEQMGNGFLVGGLASSRGGYRHVASDVTQQSISGVLFSSDITVSTRLTQGCSPQGQRHVITECQQNLIITLDDKPAVDVLKEDIGEVLAKDLGNIGGYIFVGLPVQASDTGDYLVRNIIGIDPDLGILAIGEIVYNGDSLMFCRRDPQTAYEDLIRMLNSIKSPITPKGAIYFSCMGRGKAQFGPDSRELKTVQEVLGDIPLVGFFCNGEISNSRLYGYTGVLTLFL
ncbi:MAG: FIST C-terminal domain-containing protein [Proteobacteria bacterium]|nr:FIST C-terminal domain-containing protein [Pseudomonadota bacterium]